MIHGARSTYNNQGCRCEACKEAHSMYAKNRRPQNRNLEQERYLRNPVNRLTTNKRWRNNNPDKVKAIFEQWKKETNYASTDSVRIWRLNNPEKQSKSQIKYSAKRRARKANVFYEDIDRNIVFDRDSGVCGICDDLCDPEDWHMDHVVPLVRGGSHTYTNVQVAHPKCNLHKGVA